MCLSASRPIKDNRDRSERVILAIHLWMGLCAALFLELLGITGSLMVFENEIDRGLNPKLTWIQPGDHYPSLAEIQMRLERIYPG